MSFWQNVLAFLDLSMETPQPYGWFHLIWFALSFLALIPLCRYPRNPSQKHIRRVVWVTALVVAILEVYKQINYTFAYENGITADYQWYAFPFQFCSTPMYIGLLAGIIKKGKVHESLCAYLATYALFAGVSVMVYPVSVFIGTVGINIQTMICHGSMITIGIYLMYTGYVPLKHKTILKAMPVFAVTVAMAAVMNEIAYRSGLLETDTFNMFFISPYCEPSLPVYSLVQAVVPFPLSLVLYILGFTAAGYIMLLLGMGVSALGKKIKAKKQLA
ncbi:MAG: YwaF family protein [Oscillospiraceae bacterium]|nr:YwaF family protein [Oscillospiraceae bacterium]